MVFLYNKEISLSEFYLKANWLLGVGSLLRMLVVTYFVKFSTLYETWRFITKLTKAHQQPIPWARWIQSTPSHPISLGYIQMLFSHLCLSLLCVFFLSGSCTKILHVSHLCYMHCPAHLGLLTLIIFGEAYNFQSSLLWMLTSLPPFLPYRSKHSPQHPLLEHPQSVFLPYSERPGFTLIENSM